VKRGSLRELPLRLPIPIWKVLFVIADGDFRGTKGGVADQPFEGFKMPCRAVLDGGISKVPLWAFCKQNGKVILLFLL